jgi:hypothetical protein
MLCLIVYLLTATGLAQASLLGHFNSATYPQNQSASAPSGLSPAHEVEPVLAIDLSSLTQNDGQDADESADFLLVCAALVTWPTSIAHTVPFTSPQPASPLYRSDPLRQFGTLSLQI